MNKEELLSSLREKGFSEKIVDAFSKVKREDFIPGNVRAMAYEDTALPIGRGQTISQPYTIAVMLSLMGLKKGQKVLEIGSGCGYVLSLLSEIVGEKGKVYGIEVIKELAEKSRKNLGGYDNVKIYNRNGSEGLSEKAPFDGIIISAAIRDIPEKIMAQLKNKGIIVAPKGSRFEQELIAIRRKSESEFEIKKRIPGFIFVPFIGEDS
ncbi:MAG TPA: protein-L-isoaspartate O-methyltransferase [Candidatus Nanoarchaeia archaeon]|nr:protein-L-isoaspartate O-methyltransferase [Candidatus Nanoarchaeia archaeon]